MTRPTSFPALELEIVRHAEKTGYVPGGAMGPLVLDAHLWLSSAYEASRREDKEEAKQGVGNVLAHLIVFCALQDIDMLQCLGMAWDEIKEKRP